MPVPRPKFVLMHAGCVFVVEEEDEEDDGDERWRRRIYS